MGLFDFLRRPNDDADARHRAWRDHAERVRQEIARVRRGEFPTGLFGGPPTREAQEFQREFERQEAERRDWQDVQAVRRGRLRHVSDANLGPQARVERYHLEREERDRAHHEAQAERRREEDQQWREAQEARQREAESRRHEEQRRREWELRERQERDRREREERDRRDREDRERRLRGDRARGGRW